MVLENDSPSEKSKSPAAVALRISGQVQGVGFRYFAEAIAVSYGLVGWVRNLPDGDVECEAEGPRPLLEEWIKQLKQGPPLSRIDRVSIDWKKPSCCFSSFRIR